MIPKIIYKINPLLLSLLIFLSGCNFIARVGYGSKRPKVESAKSVRSWMDKHHFEGTEIVSVSPEAYSKFSPVSLRSSFLFSTSGRFLAVGYSQGFKCIKDIDRLFMELKPPNEMIEKPDSFIIQQYFSERIENMEQYSREELIRIAREKLKTAKLKTDTVYVKFEEVVSSFRTLTGQPYTPNFAGHDYLLILPFAKFEGPKVQLDELRKKYKAAVMNKDASIKIIFLNLDIQKWWGEEWINQISQTIALK